MVKLRLLKGIANNLATSFTSVTNREYLYEIKHLKINSIEIYLLKNKITPKEANTKNGKSVVKKYKEWFIREIKKLDLSIKDIEQVIIKLKIGKFTSAYYFSVHIKVKDKEFVGKSMSMGSPW